MIFLFIPEWLTAGNFLIAVFTFLTLIAGAFIVLLLRGRTEVSSIQSDRAVAAEALVKTRDAEVLALQKQVAELEEELESITAEHRTLTALDMAQLFNFWAEKESIEASMQDLRKEIRILRLRKDGDASE
jgi:uncharacterized protein YlxW (UPF0749 family)